MTSELVDIYNGGDCVAAIDITRPTGATPSAATFASPPTLHLAPTAAVAPATGAPAAPAQPSPPPPTPPPNPSCAFESAEARKKYAFELAALADEDGSGGLDPASSSTLLCGCKWAQVPRKPGEVGSGWPPGAVRDPSGSHWRSHQLGSHRTARREGGRTHVDEMLDLTPKLDCGGGLVPFGEVSFEAFWYIVGRRFVERRLPPCSR